MFEWACGSGPLMLRPDPNAVAGTKGYGCRFAEGQGSPARLKTGLRLETVHLTRVVDGKILVGSVSVQIDPGEILAILGPSGSGKSSFLRLLNRLDEPTAGGVLVDGQDYRAIAPQKLRRRVGMVMQTA